MEAPRRRNILDYYQDILLAIFVFMLQDKGRSNDVKRLVERQFADARLVATRAKTRKDSTSGVLGAVLHEWHRNAAYLDRDVAPKAVRLLGRKPSVAALVRSQGKGSQANQVAIELRRLRLIRRVPGDRYLPVGRVATIRRLTPALIDHVARSLERLLATVNFNTRGDQRSRSLIERTAFVHDLPREDVQAFRKFAQQQGSEFLANADEWLESRRASKRLRHNPPLVRAGIHVYAFEEHLPAHQPRRTNGGR